LQEFQCFIHGRIHHSNLQWVTKEMVRQSIAQIKTNRYYLWINTCCRLLK
jgi:hypothetical protein